MKSKTVAAFFLCTAFAYSIAPIAIAKDDSPELKRAIETAVAGNRKDALPALIDAAADGQRIANYYVGTSILNWFDRASKIKEVSQLQLTSSQKSELVALAELVALRDLKEILQREFIRQSVPEFEARANRGDANAMVDLALVLDNVVEVEVRRSEMASGSKEPYSRKALELLKRAASAGNKRAISLLYGGYAMSGITGPVAGYQADQEFFYGCLLIKKGDIEIKKVMLRRFPSRRCQ